MRSSRTQVSGVPSDKSSENLHSVRDGDRDSRLLSCRSARSPTSGARQMLAAAR
jgi:hypothetical protein